MEVYITLPVWCNRILATIPCDSPIYQEHGRTAAPTDEVVSAFDLHLEPARDQRITAPLPQGPAAETVEILWSVTLHALPLLFRLQTLRCLLCGDWHER